MPRRAEDAIPGPGRARGAIAALSVRTKGGTFPVRVIDGRVVLPGTALELRRTVGWTEAVFRAWASERGWQIVDKQVR